MTVGILYCLAVLMMTAAALIVAFPTCTRNVSLGEVLKLNRDRLEDRLLAQGSVMLMPATLLLAIQAKSKFNTPSAHKS